MPAEREQTERPNKSSVEWTDLMQKKITVKDFFSDTTIVYHFKETV